ncbi:ribokinase [Jonesiaceae bacterium BS-20]|uniref:Ribokinase n=1 Tax=Jonesiaceae bacterium BS-20 TaxID=3120821 RepID=A0AAU7DRS5_9MICO
MKIAVVGSFGVGLTMNVPKFPIAGETISSGEFQEGPGGKGSNQAVGAARLGAEVSFFTAIGNDAYGQSAHDLWQSEGIDASHVVTTNNPTMVGFIMVDPSGENLIAIAPGALDELDANAIAPFENSIAAADVLVVSLEIPRAAAIEALRIGRVHGTRTLLNPAPARVLPDEAWPLIDVITPNETEAPILLGLDEGHGLTDIDLIKALQTKTNSAVILTRGSKGALIADGNEVVEIEPVLVENVVDTTGAGDSFTAALAVGLGEGWSLVDAAKFAARAGAHTVTIAGVIPSLPTRELLDLQIGNAR